MAKGKGGAPEAKCPLCGEAVELEKDVQVGDVAYCIECDQELKVLKINPPRLRGITALESEEKGLYTEEENEEAEAAADGDEAFENEYDEEDGDEDDDEENVGDDSDERE